ncbi:MULTISPECIES: 1-(5-phosphoribosyl)-5-[(5-phosphoribosylamino)methylideneamino]imidazole-4-carboxamide isomerase [Halobacillus]|uniref:1-(5-phosphoribosyl)-5-[(5- phosphoribosylamino)methylideneamino]imidazole-4- carboxamide isomerase n=1 Tax=Halobacillus TaxID=45667 RepID=UPI00136C5B6A|nr:MULTISPECIES: 1-(5-phosphoribosyl)-5-[(5-phosphoribosylamino)methylideneamino]imidazole-4-carboxamide isomerase [Halobacillus]MYL31440.1 1-(5-phosphoribosyl)-5-[(5-phosphoribosylamino)methylideneamino]imidazole-4-carboxamide isomerase [Halobacillus halophilus]MYL38405.1 1-(5-phosphoribosyl)-5-[(5-phosphoribosylamino)methylideneamino]imidazole-4-carboxamide isomerase [Halobacillus litoralis]
MSFTIYPAIDMRGGKCVRLEQGDFNKETVYGENPFDAAKQFAEAGASWIHMVDLDGAKEGSRQNAEFVLQAAEELNCRIQIGGGIRSEADVQYYLDQGVDRVIIGSLAVSDTETTKELLSKYGSRIAIGLDARDGFVSTAGWLEQSEIKAVDLAKELVEAGARTFIYTDIAKDGMLSGPNTKEIVRLAEEAGVDVIASGGIKDLGDLQELKQYRDRNVSGSIVGKALYTNQFTLQDALAVEVE